MHHLRRQRRSAVTLVELLVVIVIIVLLMGLLLVGMSKARQAGGRTATLATMHSFLRACEAFYADHGFYPGLVPESILAFHNHEISHGAPYLGISSTENALLHLMGGYAVQSEVTPAYWNDLRAVDGWVEYEVHAPTGPPFVFKFNRQRFGEGPTINGKAYPPYFRPNQGEVIIADSSDYQQWPWLPSNAPPDQHLPDLVDAWGTPILYLRRGRPHGPIVGDSHPYSAKPQFYGDAIWPYTLANTQMWEDPCNGGTGRGSILYGHHGQGGGGTGQDVVLIPHALAQILRHPVSGNVDPHDLYLPGTPRGAIVLISAGPDRIYFSAADGPGSIKRPIGCNGCGDFDPFPYSDFLDLGAEAFESFDDLIISGGGS